MTYRLLFTLALGSTLACSAEGDLTVHLTLHESDLAGIEVVAVPFDPDGLLDSLAAAATEPPPTFADLEADLFAFDFSDDEALWAINEPWLALRDSVAQLSETLQRMDRTTPEYAAAYERFRTLYTTFTRRTAERDQELRRLDGNSVELARRARAAADTLRAWERIAYEAYDSLSAAAVAQSRREPIQATSDGHGEVHISAPTATWWIIARLPDPENPFLEYYWSVPVRVNGLVPTSLTMSERAATHRWRH